MIYYLNHNLWHLVFFFSLYSVGFCAKQTYKTMSIFWFIWQATEISLINNFEKCPGFIPVLEQTTEDWQDNGKASESSSGNSNYSINRFRRAFVALQRLSRPWKMLVEQYSDQMMIVLAQRACQLGIYPAYYTNYIRLYKLLHKGFMVTCFN